MLDLPVHDGKSWTFDDMSEIVQEIRQFWHAFVGLFATRLKNSNKSQNMYEKRAP